jgi:Tfp pilus assembly protein PilW
VNIKHDEGFSLLEAVIATGLLLLVTASIFAMMHPAQGAFAAEPEVADMQQRLRVGADTLSKDLIMAGAGAYQGMQAGSLGFYFPSVLPFRQGATNDDPPGTFATDRITIIYVPSTPAQTTLGADLSGSTTTFTPAVESDCPMDPATGQPAKLCGFAQDQTVLVYDDSGSYNLFTITAVADSTATLTVKKPADAVVTTFAAGSKIVEASSHTYYLKTDVPANTYQLMHYDGTSNRGVPVVDNVVNLKFDYYGDAQPPTVRKSLSDVPATTYGPKPSGAIDGRPVLSERHQREPMGRGPAADPEDRGHAARPDRRRGAARSSGRSVHARRHFVGRGQVGAGSGAPLRHLPAQSQSRQVRYARATMFQRTFFSAFSAISAVEDFLRRWR